MACPCHNNKKLFVSLQCLQTGILLNYFNGIIYMELEHEGKNLVYRIGSSCEATDIFHIWILNLQSIMKA